MLKFQAACQRFWSEMRRDERVVLLSCFAILLGCAGVNYARWKTTPPLPPVFVDAPDKAQAASKDSHTGHLMAHVAGAVRNPGLYVLPIGARIDDAVRSAGGAVAGSDPDALNLAAPVQDGQQIIVPMRGAEPIMTSVRTTPLIESKAGAGRAESIAGMKSKPVPSSPVNVNQADATELQTLPGVGPSLAQSIITYRQQHGGLKSFTDLDAVKGIGPKKLEKLRPYVRF